MIRTLARLLRARHWHVLRNSGGRWQLRVSSDSVRGQLLCEMAEELASKSGFHMWDTAELDGNGLRLHATQSETVLSWSAGPRTDLLAVFESPDPVQARTLTANGGHVVARSLEEDLSFYSEARSDAAGLLVLSHAYYALSHDPQDPAHQIARLLLDEPGTQAVVMVQPGQGSARCRLFRPHSDPIERPFAPEDQTCETTPNAILRLMDVHETGPDPVNWTWGSSHQARLLIGVGSDAPTGEEDTKIDVLATMLAASVEGMSESVQPRAAVLQERARIASALHAGATQDLSNVALRLELLEGLIEDPDRLRPAIREMRDATLSALDMMRRSILDLSNPTQSLPLAKALTRFVEDYAAQWDMEIEQQIAPLTGEPGEEAAALAFSFVQEGLTNARKHSGSSAVQVALQEEGDGLSVLVIDRGTGFDPDCLDSPAAAGHGLALLRARAEISGGQIHLVARPGAGAKLVLRIPTR